MELTGSSFAIDAKPRDAATVAPSEQAPAAKHDFSFGDFLDIVNPLQHLPVVGTLYRAVTGDQIKTPEKLVGDALYGGVWGLVSSLADTAFQAATGKNFGDTVLALFTGRRDTKAVGTEVPAQTKPADPLSQPAAAQSAPVDVSALTAALNRNGVGYETSQRALYAYRRGFAATSPTFASAY